MEYDIISSRLRNPGCSMMGCTGNRNYVEAECLLGSGGRLRVQLRMMSIRPFIQDVAVYEYDTRTGRVAKKRTVYHKADECDLDLVMEDAKMWRFESIVKEDSEMPPEIREVVEKYLVAHQDILDHHKRFDVCGVCGEYIWNARSKSTFDSGTVTLSSTPADNRCSKCNRKEGK